MNLEKMPKIEDCEKVIGNQIQSNEIEANNIQINNSITDTIKISNLSDQLLCRKPINIQNIELINYEDNRTELQQLRSYLNKWLRIEISDGRILVGMFLCTDRDLNVILACTGEYINENDLEPRMLGLTMVPGVHIKSISIEANVMRSSSKQQTVLLHKESIQNGTNLINSK